MLGWYRLQSVCRIYSILIEFNINYLIHGALGPADLNLPGGSDQKKVQDNVQQQGKTADSIAIFFSARFYLPIAICYFNRHCFQYTVPRGGGIRIFSPPPVHRNVAC
jgi:hypothetical protein